MTWTSFFDGLVRWLCKAIRRMRKHTAEGAALFRPTGFEHVPIILWRNTSVASRMICRSRGAIHTHPPPSPPLEGGGSWRPPLEGGGWGGGWGSFRFCIVKHCIRHFIRDATLVSRRSAMLDRYTRTAVTLHWAIALLIFAAFPLGVYMHELPLSPDKLRLYSYHKWIGVSIFLLAVLRGTSRSTHRPPLLPAAMPRWEKLAASTVHYLLYALILAVPLSGWLMSSAKGVQTVWFGVLPL